MTVVTYNGWDFELPVDRQDPRFAFYDAMARAEANYEQRLADGQVAPEVDVKCPRCGECGVMVL